MKKNHHTFQTTKLEGKRTVCGEMKKDTYIHTYIHNK